MTIAQRAAEIKFQNGITIDGMYWLRPSVHGSLSRSQAVDFIKREGNFPWALTADTLREFGVILDGNKVSAAQ